MNPKKTLLGAMAAAFVAMLGATEAAKAQDTAFIPMLTYRTGPFSVGGIPLANGFRDYLQLINARDGGVEGVELEWEECETEYNTEKGVECYNRLKDRGLVFSPNSTGITYSIIEQAAQDGVSVFSMGYGRADSADGRVFKWVFNFPTSYWSQATAWIKYIGQIEGGMDKLAGKSFGYLFLDSAYGREPIPTLELLAEQYGYTLSTYSVPGASMGDQSGVWLKIERDDVDWMLMSGWGLMNQTAIKEASEIEFPMDHFIGNWWSGSEADVLPSGQAAAGYLSGTFTSPGSGYPVHAAILENVYGGDEAAAEDNQWGQVLYNRGVSNAAYIVEAIRGSIAEFGKPVTAANVRWGLENLSLDDARLAELGMTGFIASLQVTCADHEGGGGALVMQQWSGEKWEVVSDAIPVMHDITRPMAEASALEYANEKNITPRDCS
jgi:branched-chain amino acid transport system substrate-binding protein